MTWTVGNGWAFGFTFSVHVHVQSSHNDSCILYINFVLFMLCSCHMRTCTCAASGVMDASVHMFACSYACTIVRFACFSVCTQLCQQVVKVVMYMCYAVGVNTLSLFYSKDTMKDVKKLDIRPEMLQVCVCTVHVHVYVCKTGAFTCNNSNDCTCMCFFSKT